MAWASHMFVLLHKTDWKRQIPYDPQAVAAMHQFWKHINTTPIGIFHQSKVDWSLIGDAVEGKVAAVLYEGEVPYAGQNPG